MGDVDLDALDSDLGFVLDSEQKEAVESLLKGRDVLVYCLRDLEKAWYFSSLFWKKIV